MFKSLLMAMAVGAGVSVPSWVLAQDCSKLNVSTANTSLEKRLITAEDLVRLRDIGGAGNGNPRAQIFSLSPDGRHLAFQLRQADPSSNSYCFGMFILDMDRKGLPRQLDEGGEFIKLTFSALGYAVSTPPGIPIDITPKWAPDGQWIAYLKRTDGSTQVWRAKADGTVAEQMTYEGFDVEDFAWAADGKRLIISGRPGLATARRKLDAEGRSGYLYDERFMPAASNRPYVREPIETETFSLEIGSHTPATAQENAGLSPETGTIPHDAISLATGKRGEAGWLTEVHDPRAPWNYRLSVRLENGETVTCVDAACVGVTNLWWLQDGRTVILQTGSASTGQVSFFRWQPHRGKPAMLFRSDDVFIGCQLASSKLICAQETFVQPRRLVSVDYRTGDISPIFDPNPEFKSLRLGSVQRLRWKNDIGIEAYGDLVLPPSHVPGQQHPLVIVQYGSRGFLRGGTGDDYPIQVFASHGIAVLSTERPIDYGTFMKAATADDEDRLGQMNWADRKSVHSSMEAGIRSAEALGVIDPVHIGLTGLSDGASTVQFAMVNSRKYAAMAMSNCCVEQMRINALLGPLISDRYNKRLGYPKLTDDGRAFWAQMSLRMNAQSIDVPLLLQLPDDEYEGALESYEALKENGKPVEMFVYPDENHVKWQPAHRLASYSRSVDWFDFWLRHTEDPNPAKADQYRRWRQMKAEMARSGSN